MSVSFEWLNVRFPAINILLLLFYVNILKRVLNRVQANQQRKLKPFQGESAPG